jgi:hypothetical protein
MVSVFGFRLPHRRKPPSYPFATHAQIAEYRRQHPGNPDLVDSQVEAPREGAREKKAQEDRRAQARMLRSTPTARPVADDIKRCFNRYPELAWLADPELAASPPRSVLGADAGEGSYCKMLGLTQFFPELERRLLSLRCFSLITAGCDPSHEEFVACQPRDTLQLRFESFDTLYLQRKKIVKEKKADLLQAVETALVLGDIGKSPKVRAQMKAFGIDDPDHDDFYRHVMLVPEARESLPSFSVLNEEQKLFLVPNKMSSHWDKITHCEGGLAMYEQLRCPSGKAHSFPVDFSMLVHICNVAGALGDQNNQGSLTYNEHTHMAVQDTIMACSLEELVFGDATPLKAYHKYLALRAIRLGLTEMGEKDNHLLARLGAMLDLFTPADGRALWCGYFQLSKAEQLQALAVLLPEGEAKLPSMPTHMRAVLVNLHKNPSLGESPEDRIKLTAEIGVLCMTRALQAYLALVESGKMGRDVALNFEPIARVAATDPYALAQRQVKIDPATGAVTLARVMLPR